MNSNLFKNLIVSFEDHQLLAEAADAFFTQALQMGYEWAKDYFDNIKPDDIKAKANYLVQFFHLVHENQGGASNGQTK